MTSSKDGIVYAAVVAAAGASSRTGHPVKKEYRMLSGKPVIVHAVLPFLADARCACLVVTVPSGHVPRATALLARYVDMGKVRVVEGGRTRQESVLRGLEALVAEAPSLVLIHDGARPWLNAELIDRVLQAACRHGACVPVAEAAEAVKQRDTTGMIDTHFPRHTICFAQTPQGFNFAKILSAHRRASEDRAHCVDDAEVYALYEGKVAAVNGEISNRKITYPHDLRAGGDAHGGETA